MKEDNWTNNNTEIIKKYFENNLSEFNLVKLFAHGPFWGIEYSKNGIKIAISGDIGFNIVIEIDSKQFNLWEYNREVNKAMKTTEENILFQLNVLKKFLN